MLVNIEMKREKERERKKTGIVLDNNKSLCNPSEQTNIKRYGNRETGKRAPYLSL